MKPRHRSLISLNRLILTRATVLVTATALMTCACFVWFGMLPMAEQVAEEQFDNVTTRVEAGLDAVFAPPTQLLQMSRGWLAGVTPDLDSPEAFNRWFKPVLKNAPELTSVVAGTSTGQGWLLLQQPDGGWRNRMTDIPRWGRERHLLFDETPDGTVSRHWSDQSYDARQRPWFKAAQALANGHDVAWTAPYTFFTTGDPGITASVLTHLPDGRDFVLGLDLKLRDLSQSTLRATVGKHGLALVLTEDERVLALPARPPSIPAAEWLQGVLKPAAQLQLAPVTDALASWHRSDRQTAGVLNFTSKGERWLARVHVYPLGAQKFWVLTLAPAADFSPAWLPIMSALTAALTLVMGLVLLMARWETLRLTRPLETLAKVNDQIGQLDFHRHTAVHSRVTEISQLASAQDAMLGLLQHNQQELAARAEALRDQVTTLTATEATLRQQNGKLATIIESFPGGVMVCDAELHLSAYNDQFKQLLHLPEALFNKPVVEFEDFIAYIAHRGDLGPGDRAQQIAASVASARHSKPREFERVLPNGMTLEVRGMPLPEGGFVALYTDISERKRAETELKLAASVFSHAREGITITSADGTIIDVNDTFSRITGYSRDEVLGKNPRILSSGRQDKAFYATMWHDLIENGHWSGELWNQRKDGSLYAQMLTISAVRGAHGAVQHYVALFSDITALKEHERELEHIAHFDALTGLPNRVLLADRLHQAKAQALRHGQRLAVAYLDLDGFKRINDSHGHDAGDQLLIAIAERMKQTLREGDTLARLGGDEFVVVLLDLPDVGTSAPMLKRLLAAVAEPFQFGDELLQVSASLGVTFFPQTDDVDTDLLLRQADQAMYQAKQAGKNHYQEFDAEQDRNLRGHHESVDRIRRALAEGEFVLHYQPKVNMRTGVVVGAEALIRWQHPKNGLLQPAAFLPVIEDHPLAIDIGEWVIDTALTQAQRWQASGLNIPVSVNVGARQLQQAGFVERLRQILADHPQVQPSSLELEILETSALEDLARVSQVMADCQKIGVSFALDDFGTGYSSLTYLKRLPVRALKIDRSFVRDMLDDPDDLSILDGVLGLAIAFHREVIAEGVETLAHGALLLQLGCDLAQGYGIARPMPGDHLAPWAASWRVNPDWAALPAVRRADLPLLYAGVEHRAWVGAIEHYLQRAHEAPPPMEMHQCRFGQWLDAGGLSRQGASAAFQTLVTLHQQVHALAIELCELRAGEHVSEALARLPELHDLRDALLEQLESLLQKNGRE